MIIFYNKGTGEIVGTIDGRIHSEEHLKMWVGDKKDTDRIIVEWKPIKYYNEKGNTVDKNSPDVFTADFEPDTKQKKIFFNLDKKPIEIYNYKVDTQTKELVKK